MHDFFEASHKHYREDNLRSMMLDQMLAVDDDEGRRCELQGPPYLWRV